MSTMHMFQFPLPLRTRIILAFFLSVQTSLHQSIHQTFSTDAQIYVNITASNGSATAKIEYGPISRRKVVSSHSPHSHTLNPAIKASPPK